MEIGSVAKTGALSWSAVQARLGLRISGADQWAGYLHRFAMYNRALTATEVAEHYAAG